MSLLQWLPLPLLPPMAVQAYGDRERIDIRTLSLYVSKRRPGPPPHPIPVHLAYPYWAIAMLSASIAPPHTPWFFPLFALLTAWALWGQRPATAHRATWLILFCFVAGTGYAGHILLHRLHGVVEERVSGLFAGETGSTRADPNRSSTTLGRIGALKLSDELVMRVRPLQEVSGPFLLREATYVNYGEATWFAGEGPLQTLLAEADGTTWQLAPSDAAGSEMTIAMQLTDGTGLLPLPAGTKRLSRLSAERLEQTALESVIITGGKRIADFTAAYVPGADDLPPPTARDLRVPPKLITLIRRIAEETGLYRLPPAERITALETLFREQFRYSTVQEQAPAGVAPLENFLLKSHAGHCEYFATATVLLLREAGIPARYATGYSVQEFSKWENAYVVRSRHAHAWVVACVDGRWQTVDTTPPTWADLEKPQSSLWRRISDFLGWCGYRLSTFIWPWDMTAMARHVRWLLMAAVIGILLYFVARKTRRSRSGGGPEKNLPLPGTDSEWYLLEPQLSAIGGSRRPGEPSTLWLERIRHYFPINTNGELLLRIVDLHYRYRFDPEGISAEEREEMRHAVKTILEQLERLSQTDSPPRGN